MRIHLKIIYNYISGYVSVREDIQDIVQETMLSIWKGVGNFKNESTFQTWALGITRRKIADYYRTVYKNASEPLSEYEDVLTAEDEYDRVIEKSAVREAVTVLNKAERDIVFLVFNAQLSYADVSEITGIPVGTIKSKMSGIKAKLTKQLGKGGEYE